MANLTPLQRWQRRLPGLYRLTHPKTVVLEHHGVAMIDIFGRLLILDSTPERGPSWTDFATFSGDATVSVVEFKDLSFLPIVMARLQKYLAEHPNFNIATSNCEHFVNVLWSGQHESKQVKGWGLAAAGLLALFFFGR